jgi:hypothetical protein
VWTGNLLTLGTSERKKVTGIPKREKAENEE